MQVQNDEYANASNDYFKMLNKVNLLLLKEHAFLLQKQQYQQEIKEVDAEIESFRDNPDGYAHLSIQAQFDHVHKKIKANKQTISHQQMKLQKRQTMINYLSELNSMHNKYEKLINTDYQNGIQQKLSMIRGKVDDLKKKIKEINKDILSYQQEHSELIDEYSFQVRNLEICRQKNQTLMREIQELRVARRK